MIFINEIIIPLQKNTKIDLEKGTNIDLEKGNNNFTQVTPHIFMLTYTKNKFDSDLFINLHRKKNFQPIDESSIESLCPISQ